MFDNKFSLSIFSMDNSININIDRKNSMRPSIKIITSCIEINTDVIDNFCKKDSNSFCICICNNTDNDVLFSVDSGYICCHNQCFDVEAVRHKLPANEETNVKVKFHISSGHRPYNNNHCELCISIDKFDIKKTYTFSVKDVAEHINQLFIKNSVGYYHGVLFGMNDIQSCFKQIFASQDMISIQKLKVVKEYNMADVTCIEFCLKIQIHKECNTYEIEEYISSRFDDTYSLLNSNIAIQGELINKDRYESFA